MATAPRRRKLVDIDAAASWSTSTRLHTYVVYPGQPSEAPAIVVIHGNRGLTNWVRSVADRVAEDGSIALAPDLLSGRAPNGGSTKDFPTEDVARDAIRKLVRAKVIEQLRAVVAYASDDAERERNVSVGGFCWGGSRTWHVVNNVGGISKAFLDRRGGTLVVEYDSTGGMGAFIWPTAVRSRRWRCCRSGRLRSKGAAGQDAAAHSTNGAGRIHDLPAAVRYGSADRYAR